MVNCEVVDNEKLSVRVAHDDEERDLSTLLDAVLDRKLLCDPAGVAEIEYVTVDE